QDAARSDDNLTLSEETTSNISDKPSPLVLGISAVIALILIGFFSFRAMENNAGVTVAELTPEVELTATPQITATPTPLALEAQDDIIRDGDDERTVAYPVSLQ